MKLKTLLSSLLLLAGFSATGGGLSRAAQEDHHLGVRHAVEVEFEAERGHTYRLQRSTDFVHWEDVGDELYGHGRREDRLMSTRALESGAIEVYRVVATEAPVDGPAPWSLAGMAFSLDDTPGEDQMKFLTETNGVDQGEAPDPFTYRYTRLGTNEAKVEITYTPAKLDTLTLTFLTASSGTWVRDEYRKGRLKDRDTGVFGVLDANGQPLPPAGEPGANPPKVPAEIPAALAGLAYTFQSGETPVRLEFTSAVSGTEFGDDVADTEANGFTHQYTLASTNTASLVVTFKPGRWDEYDLTYTGPAKGTYVRREFKSGVLKDTDHGAFSAVLLPQGAGNPGGEGGSGTMPTGTLEGLNYVMNDGGAVPTRLGFTSSTAGTQLDDSAPSAFTYTYTVTGGLAAQLVIRFKADKWDEYDLVFVDGANAGTFIRREFDGNVLKDTDSGGFTGGTTAP